MVFMKLQDDVFQYQAVHYLGLQILKMVKNGLFVKVIRTMLVIALMLIQHLILWLRLLI